MKPTYFISKTIERAAIKSNPYHLLLSTSRVLSQKNRTCTVKIVYQFPYSYWNAYDSISIFELINRDSWFRVLELALENFLFLTAWRAKLGNKITKQSLMFYYLCFRLPIFPFFFSHWFLLFPTSMSRDFLFITSPVKSHFRHPFRQYKHTYNGKLETVSLGHNWNYLNRLGWFKSFKRI